MSLHSPLRFADVFAGCGGLSLGLTMAGCKGVFAIERHPMAYETLRHNLVDGSLYQFDWPTWLPKEAISCENLLNGYATQLSGLKGSIDLLVGGPPCQGFSTAGKRNPSDPRNKMTEQYLSLVALLQPRFIVIENVSGFDMRFEDEERILDLMSDPKGSYAKYVAEQLRGLGYHVNAGLVNCADFGVPQNRKRFLMICERECSIIPATDLMASLAQSRKTFLQSHGLPTSRHVTAKDAISDLETLGKKLTPSTDTNIKGFQQLDYSPPARLSKFQELMRKNMGKKAPNSLRLARHREDTIINFKVIQAMSRPGTCLSASEREILGIKKHSLTVLSDSAPAPTVTTLPDDILHYSEPRILSVRENARLQSFPDWFDFLGKYTTGGRFRKLDCPRYTQVGNAVPPLLAKAIGLVLTARVASTKVDAKLEKTPSY